MGHDPSYALTVTAGVVLGLHCSAPKPIPGSPNSVNASISRRPPQLGLSPPRHPIGGPRDSPRSLAPVRALSKCGMTLTTRRGHTPRLNHSSTQFRHRYHIGPDDSASRWLEHSACPPFGSWPSRLAMPPSTTLWHETRPDRPHTQTGCPIDRPLDDSRSTHA